MYTACEGYGNDPVPNVNVNDVFGSVEYKISNVMIGTLVFGNNINNTEIDENSYNPTPGIGTVRWNQERLDGRIFDSMLGIGTINGI